MTLTRTSYNVFNLIDPGVISGLVQSDGSFSVSIVKSNSALVRPQFSITLMLSSLNLLKAIQQYFGIGHIEKIMFSIKL